MRKQLLLFFVMGFAGLAARADESDADDGPLSDADLMAGPDVAVVEPPVAAPNPKFLNWEHTLVTRTSKSPHAVAKLKIYNNWTSSRHRMLVAYNVLGLGAQANWVSKEIGPSFSMPDFNPGRFLGKGADYHHGSLGVIQRLDDDKILAYSSDAGSYFVQPRLALMKRLRFDPWKKLAPELSKELPPSLTPAQRERMGREVRSLSRPLLKKVFKSYFRAIPASRTFPVAGEKIEAKGYRLALLFNAGDEYQGDKWYRLNVEWWLAPPTPADGIRQEYQDKMAGDLTKIGGFTTSMWMNEMLPIIWQTMPQEMHLAAATLLPKGLFAENSSSVPGVPVYAAITMAPPKDAEEFDETGTIRVEVQLTRRNVNKLDSKIFEAPAQYKKESLEPTLKEWDSGMDLIQSIFDEELKLADAGIDTKNGARPKYTWRAMKEYLQSVQSISR